MSTSKHAFFGKILLELVVGQAKVDDVEQGGEGVKKSYFFGWSSLIEVPQNMNLNKFDAVVQAKSLKPGVTIL